MIAHPRMARRLSEKRPAPAPTCAGLRRAPSLPASGGGRRCESRDLATGGRPRHGPRRPSSHAFRPSTLARKTRRRTRSAAGRRSSAGRRRRHMRTIRCAASARLAPRLRRSADAVKERLATISSAWLRPSAWVGPSTVARATYGRHRGPTILLIGGRSRDPTIPSIGGRHRCPTILRIGGRSRDLTPLILIGCRGLSLVTLATGGLRPGPKCPLERGRHSGCGSVPT